LKKAPRQLVASLLFAVALAFRNAPVRYADREKTMLRFSLASLVLATLCVFSWSAAHAKTCIRDLAGQIVCGELVETRDEPNDQAGLRQDDSRDPRQDRPYRDGCGHGWFYNGRACVQDDGKEPRYAPRYRGGGSRYHLPPPSPHNRPRPVMGANGQISCNNPNYTWQDGACKPYRGPR
jgi:hypothetical protein